MHQSKVLPQEEGICQLHLIVHPGNYQKCQVLWVWLTPLPWGKPLTGTYGGPGFPSEYVFQNWASEILN